MVDGKWYVVVKGDYAGRVYGYVYDITNTTAPTQIPTTVRACHMVTYRNSWGTQLGPCWATAVLPGLDIDLRLWAAV